jgi:hypothetical protein
MRVVDSKFIGVPIVFGRCLKVELTKQIDTTGCSNEQGKTISISQCWLQHFVPGIGVDVCNLVDHHPV